MEFKTRNVIVGVITALVVVFIGGWLLGRLARDNASTTIISGQNDIITTYEYRIGDMERLAHEKDAIISSQREAIKAGLILKEELKALKIKYVRDLTRVNATVEILLDSIASYHPIIIPCPEGELYHPVLYLPLAFQDTTEFYNITGRFDTTGVLSIGVKIPMSLDVWVGEDREIKGNFKTVVTTDNPYITINGFKSCIFDLPKRRKWAVGIQAGYGLVYANKQIYSAPFVGLGISRTIVSF